MVNPVRSEKKGPEHILVTYIHICINVCRGVIEGGCRRGLDVVEDGTVPTTMAKSACNCLLSNPQTPSPSDNSGTGAYTCRC